MVQFVNLADKWMNELRLWFIWFHPLVETIGPDLAELGPAQLQFVFHISVRCDFQAHFSFYLLNTFTPLQTFLKQDDVLNLSMSLKSGIRDFVLIYNLSNSSLVLSKFSYVINSTIKIESMKHILQIIQERCSGIKH